MFRRPTILFPLLSLLLLAGCDRSTTEPEHGEPEQVQLLDHDTGTILASYTEGSTWQGSLPVIEVGEDLEVGVRFLDEDGHEVHLEDGYSAAAELASGASAGILAIDAHGDHLDIEGLAPGTVQVIFQLYHGNHSDWDSEPLAITVVQ